MKSNEHPTSDKVATFVHRLAGPNVYELDACFLLLDAGGASFGLDILQRNWIGSV